MDKEVWVGCSGYFYWDWRGPFYPDQAPPSSWFEFYAERFDTVEMNSTYYRFPTEATVKRWLKKAQPGFRFTAKAPRRITHVERMGDPASVASLYEVLSLLGDHLGAILFQLPPSLNYSPENLKRVLAPLDPAFDNALEFRHPSWWRDEVYQALDAAGAIFASVSAPELPDRYVETAGKAYLRFHGRTDWHRYLYNEEELSSWTQRVLAGSAQVVYAYFNNDPDAAAPRNALAFQKMLEGV